MLDELRNHVLAANLEIAKADLAKLTWGNVSGIDRESGLVVIKPSGVDYAQLKAENLVIVDLDGKVVEGGFKPSSDTATHVRLYRAFPQIGGVTHTHSPCATAFAQALREIPCLGTTHADHFLGSIPVTRNLTPEEIEADYEGNTGTVIIERFLAAAPAIDPMDMPGVLVAHHAPFAWGKNAKDAIKNAIALEGVAEMALKTFALNPGMGSLPSHILRKHFNRKHGPGAYYGQGMDKAGHS